MSVRCCAGPRPWFLVLSSAAQRPPPPTAHPHLPPPPPHTHPHPPARAASFLVQCLFELPPSIVDEAAWRCINYYMAALSEE